MSGVQEVMARIGSIQSLAQRAGGGFAGMLGSAMVTERPAPTSTTLVAARPAGLQRSATPPSGAARWQASIDRAAQAHDLDPTLLTALVWVESNFVPDAVSHAGAVGLTQLMPDTASQLGVDPYDPEANLQGGARFLRAMIDRFGRIDLALAAYNAGPARVGSLHDGGPGVPVAEGYVTAVLDRYRQLGGTP